MKTEIVTQQHTVHTANDGSKSERAIDALRRDVLQVIREHGELGRVETLINVLPDLARILAQYQHALGVEAQCAESDIRHREAAFTGIALHEPILDNALHAPPNLALLHERLECR